MWGQFACASALFATLLVPGVSAAGSAAGAIDLSGAIERALARNPELSLNRYLREAQTGRMEQAGLRPNPQLGLTVENVLGSGPYQGTDGAETTLSLAWVLERGKRDRRVAVAEAGLEHLQVLTDIERLEVAGRATEAFLAVLRDQERLRQAEEALALGDRVVDAVERRVEAGRSPMADLDRVRADRVWLELSREEVVHRLLISRRLLASTWGSSEPDFSEVSGRLYSLPEVGSYEALIARLAESPRINRYLTERRLREAEVALAETRARPNWQVEVGLRHFSLGGDEALVAGITLPLAMRNRNQGQITETRALAAMTDGERIATRLAIETTLHRLHEELRHNVHRFEGIRDRVLPLVERMVGDAERAYELGRYGYFDLRQVQLRLLESKAALLEQAYLAHLNRAGIERLTGTVVADEKDVTGGAQR